jgi:uncharacterized protein (DUF697 family)
MLPKTIGELERIKEECKSMVTKRAVASGGAAVIPVPGTDVAADVGMLLQLLPAINKRFGLSPDQIEELDTHSKTILYGIIKTIGSRLVGQIITKEIIMQILKKIGTRFAVKQVTKFIPFVGQATSAAISFGAMKYVGNSHIDECYEVAKRFINHNNT